MHVSLIGMVLKSCVGSALTLYMFALLVRWVAPWLELDLRRPYLRWLPRITDPLIQQLRRLLPPTGPMDWGPIAAILSVWAVRYVLLQY
jgi:YggT family protein